MIPLAECIPRGVYRIQSRNLDVGVFDGETGFIGIREKFDSRYLFTEYHYEAGAPFGTVRTLELLGMLPDGIEVWEMMPGTVPGRSSGSWDSKTGREVSFDNERKKRAEETGIGWGWYFVDPEEDDPECKIQPHARMYTPLFDYLDRSWSDSSRDPGTS